MITTISPSNKYLEFKLGKSDHQRLHLVHDDIHSDLVFTRGFDDSFLGLIEEDDNTSHHTDSLIIQR